MRVLRSALVLALVVAARAAAAFDVSPPPILQWFESSYRTMEARLPDVFMAGYGFVWVPPPGRADTGDQSVGYDVYDRFDLGRPERPTLYGTETGLRHLATMLHRAGIDLHIDFVMNHNGYSNLGTPGFAKAGGYPGLAITLPDDVDGDFHSAFAGGDDYERLAGLIDIAQEKNHRFIRSPVQADPRNIPAGTTPAFGRLANVPDPANRRFYPEAGHDRIFVFDPKTGQGNIAVDAFDPKNPMGGTPSEENATGYLMRNAQWLIQVIGADGLRIDAAKHMPGFVLDFLDRAVYRMNRRALLDGSPKDVFSYTEVFDANPAVLLPYVRKDINHADPGRIGGNRDTLDFKLYFALKNNLESSGTPNAWQSIKDAALDVADDGLHNGSAGVTFIQSHDVFKPFWLDQVAQAYTLMMPGNTIVYFNGKEFGNRDFPKYGQRDALGVGGDGTLLGRLLQARITHGRGDYAERWDGTDGLFAFERVSSAIVLLSNRGDAGFDSRTLVNVGFAPGTWLVELTGNASDPRVNPDRGGRRDVPEVVQVFSDGGVSKVNVRFQRPATMDADGRVVPHGRGVLVYGLPTPEAPRGLELTNVAKVMAGDTDLGTDAEVGTRRRTDVSVITADRFDVRLRTQPVRLLGSNAMRDVWADGDGAMLRLDDGRDVNGNGRVDVTTPGDTAYGFERFATKSSPLIGAGGINGPRGDGEFRQTIDATRLEEGLHFLTARAWRHRTDGGPAVFSDFKRVIYVDRVPPRCRVDGVRRTADGVEVDVRSTDATADVVHVLLDVPANATDASLLARAGQGQGRLDRVDRDLFRGRLAAGTTPGAHRIAIVAFEPSGSHGVQRETLTVP